MSIAEWIAVDWGTTHLRTWTFDANSSLLDQATSDQGMGQLTPAEFEPALLALIGAQLPANRTTPVICCGMVGAAQGWVEAAYAPVPARPPDATTATRAPAQDPRLDVRILPGMNQNAPADVMRGEETQIAGFLALNPEFDGVICLPGTHTKWAQISAGEVVSFASFMTGELFALLSMQSVLKHSVDTDGWDDDAFVTAVDEALSHPQKIAASLFRLRAEGLLNALPPATAKARLSGLLLGLELGGARPYWLGQQVVIIGTDALCQHYATALASQGVLAEQADAQTMTLAGLTRAYATLKGSSL